MGMEFMNYGGKEDFLEHSEGKVGAFNEKSGGDVDPYGDKEAKSKGEGNNQNAAEAFSKKDLSKVDADGTDAAKKKYKQFDSNTGDHFKVGEVSPSGESAAKSKSFHSARK